MLYNALVLPHLQYCLMIWGDFKESHNLTLGSSLLKLQKRLVGIIAGEFGKYHSDPLFARFSILKVEDLYRQQLRIHAWKFWNNKLPENQKGMLCRVSDVHRYSTRLAGTGISLGAQDHRCMSYKIPKEWESLPNTLREMLSITGFKNKSKESFFGKYKEFRCTTRNCYICGLNNSGENRNVGLELWTRWLAGSVRWV